ncbi:hypothetical protein [Lacticaseibacillus kribbianus]|nr:hypothetical protein [Lacticaseibacillus kribbianus]
MIGLTGTCATAQVFTNLEDSARDGAYIQDSVEVTDIIKPVYNFKA